MQVTAEPACDLSTSFVRPSTDSSADCTVNFHVVGDLACNNTILHLCWVQENSSLEVYTKVLPPSELIELDTFVGHSWVLYRLDLRATSDPGEISAIQQDQIVCSFRTMVEGCHTVVVQLDRHGSVDARAYLDSKPTARVSKSMRPTDLTAYPAARKSEANNVSLMRPLAALRWTKKFREKFSRQPPPCDISFHIVSNISYKRTPLRLCWVRADGSLEVYSKPLPPSEYVELSSFVGHAWLLYRWPCNRKSKPTKTSDIDSASLILAFLPLAEGEHVVVVQLGDHGSVYAQTWKVSGTEVERHLPIAKVRYARTTHMKSCTQMYTNLYTHTCSNSVCNNLMSY